MIWKTEPYIIMIILVIAHMFNILEPYYVDMDIMISYSRLFDHTEEEKNQMNNL